MRIPVKKLTACAALAALALGLSALERLIPVSMIIPLPFFKLGLANIVTLFALFYLDGPSAFFIVLVRTFLSAALFGGPISFVYSFCGASAALLIMLPLSRLKSERLSPFGISVAGAAAHGLAQLAAAALLLKSAFAFYYLPVMLLLAIPSGLFTGACFCAVNYAFAKKGG